MKRFVLWGATLCLIMEVILILMQHYRSGHVDAAQWIFLGWLLAILMQFVVYKVTHKLPVQYR
jgi:hypothetical protein